MIIACAILVIILIGLNLVFEFKYREAQGEIKLAKEQITVNPIMLNWLRTEVDGGKVIDMFALYGLEKGASDEGKEFKKVNEEKALEKTNEILERVSSEWGISVGKDTFSAKGIEPVVLGPLEVYTPGISLQGRIVIPIAYNPEEKSVEVEFKCDGC